jgi:hypothetical protein
MIHIDIVIKLFLVHWLCLIICELFCHETVLSQQNICLL